MTLGHCGWRRGIFLPLCGPGSFGRACCVSAEPIWGVLCENACDGVLRSSSLIPKEASEAQKAAFCAVRYDGTIVVAF